MWGNLAGRLAQTDIHGALEKIGNAVAPREDDDDDDEEYYDDDDQQGDEYEDDDDDDDDEYEDDEVEDGGGMGSPFGIVGMLTRALDDRGDPDDYEDDDDNEGYADNSEQLVADPAAAKATNPIPADPVVEILPSLPIPATNVPASKSRRMVEQPPAARRSPTPAAIVPKPSVAATSVAKTTDDWGGDWEDTTQSLGKAKPVQNGSPTIPSTTEMMPTSKNSGQSTESGQGPLPPGEFASRPTIRVPSTDRVSKLRSHGDQAKKITHSLESNSVTPTAVSTATESVQAASPRDRSTTKSTITSKQQLRPDEVKRDGEYSLSSSTTQETQETGYVRAQQPRVVGEKSNVDYRPNAKTTATTTTTATPTITAPSIPPVESPHRRSDTNPATKRRSDTKKVVPSSENGPTTATADRVLPTVPASREPSDSIRVEPVVVQDHATTQKLVEAERQCEQLQAKLKAAEEGMDALRKQALADREKAKAEQDDLLTKFQEKEYRLLQATSEENRTETLQMQQQYESKIKSLEDALAKEREGSTAGLEEYKKLVRDSDARADRAEQQLNNALKRHENELSQSKQREERALLKADDRVAQSMAVLDERNDEIAHLKKLIRDIESKVNEHQEGAEEAEEEVEELHEENDSLRKMIEDLQAENKDLKDKLGGLEADSDRLAELQMQLTMLKEERDRERAKNQSVVNSAITTHSQIETERDVALSELRDLKQQLAAALADLEVAKADASRIMTANTNLQSALEAFQDERQAEMNMIDEERRESEEAIKAAHATAIAAMKQTHQAELHDVQKAAGDAVQKSLREMELLEGSIEKLRSENNQMRRSLDEAIYRLQTTQEDVIDRDVMKNIILDWCTLKENSKRQQVLQVMANLLHFSEEEREKVHLTGLDLDSVGSRFVETLAPRRSATADVEHLEGDNVREKWVNFLLAETDGDL